MFQVKGYLQTPPNMFCPLAYFLNFSIPNVILTAINNKTIDKITFKKLDIKN